MIEGLKIDVSSEELARLLREREVHHNNRVETYATKIDALKEAGVEELPVSGDPLSGLQTKVIEHQRKYALFHFLREHLIPHEIYRLTETDLARLEILSRYY
jgi:hypothetical protein